MLDEVERGPLFPGSGGLRCGAYYTYLDSELQHTTCMMGVRGPLMVLK